MVANKNLKNTTSKLSKLLPKYLVIISLQTPINILVRKKITASILLFIFTPSLFLKHAYNS